MEHLHQNHRQRMIDRGIKEGLSGFADHELLEVFLYQTQPRIDTNPCAHALLKRFGSLQEVMNASIERLCEVEGMGERSAFHLKLCVELLRRYLMEDQKPGTKYDTLGKVRDYLYPLFYGVDYECLYMMMFNSQLKFIDCVLLSEGSVNATSVPTAKVAYEICHKNASAVVFAHNHPGGIAIPSGPDNETNHVLYTFLSQLNVVQLEHLIFAGDRFCTIMEKQNGYCRTSPISQKIDVDFYKAFYDLGEDGYVLSPKFPREKD